ncbi:hypothetical protein MD484_g5620, partial [Candolleomyces efflorescens]
MKILNVKPPTVLTGGGIHIPRTFSQAELAAYAAPAEIQLKSGRYELLRYLHRDRLNELLDENPQAFALSVPLDIVAPRMTVKELQSMARVHKVPVLRNHVKADLLMGFKNHACAACMEYTTVFKAFSAPVQGSFRKEYAEKMCAAVKPLSLSELSTGVDLTPAQGSLYAKGGKVVAMLERHTPIDLATCGANAVVTNVVPWLALARRGSKTVAIFLAKLHGIVIPARPKKEYILEELKTHMCNDCPQFQVVFQPVLSPKTGKEDNQQDRPIQDDVAYVRSPPPLQHHYPPSPLSIRNKASIIAEFTSSILPSRFEEAGCAVCGQLTLLSDLTPLDPAEVNLDPLVEIGLVRLERRSVTEPVKHHAGPVLDASCSQICGSCLASLVKGKRPVNALANGLWIGTIPKELSSLTYAEQCLVARVRTNRYVIRVASGHSKLSANAIAFPCPTLKVYKHLPPKREELSEVLAFIFTGVKPPTEVDLGRTPMLVRRNVVADALEWLRLNHSDYADLLIDREALLSYPEWGVPVEMIHRPSDDGSNIIPSATSVHEVNEEEGTDSGQCLFTVHALVGGQLETMSMSARKAAALQHLRTGGSVLAIGHSETPESMYHNPQLYPQLFPWLFPYGMGGLGNTRVQGLISESKQKRLYLMYHDKRFQTDTRFVLLAFNHEQMKSGASASFVLTRRRNFATMASEVALINPAVIMNISNRLQAGERVIPQTEEEKRCFALMDQIDHVGESVHGSLASKKRMRTELWSLISNLGAPSWFITVSPVDNKHPLCIYWADKNIKFHPDLKEYNERVRLVASNPIAGARFFHFLVELLIKHLLRWADDQERPGVFGHTSAYFGTVEQQGRMTLHVHMLIWIANSLNPQQVRDKLLSEDSDFKAELLAYLESCQVGEFLTGTMDEMKDRMSAQAEGITCDDPVQTLPIGPPALPCHDVEGDG